MTHFTEQSLETAIMQMLEEVGYAYTPGQEIHKTMDDVLLRDDLRAYLRSRYRAEALTEVEVETAIARLTASRGFTLYEQNRHTLRLMTEGFTLRREDTSKPDLYVEPIDYGHAGRNLLRVVNQLEIQGTERRIPDAVIYVNGLPVVVMEFKSATKEETTILDAYKQLTVRYRRDIPELFKYNAFVVVSDGVNSKYGSLFTPYEYFYAWRKVEADERATDGIGSLATMIRGMLRPDRLLGIVRDFIFMPDSSKREEKIICRYPQYFATQKLMAHIRRHSRMAEGGDGKGGTYFGATGCGKSYTMLFLTRQLMRSRDFKSPTIILITDRTDLDLQLSEQFGRAKGFIGDDCVVEVESREALRQYLKGRESGGVFLTTIHKFNEDVRLLSRRSNIVCISDEAHRSQTNLREKVTQTDEGVRRSFGFAKHLHDSLPNATYVGFTGTPVDATIEVFGEVVDAYTMTESVADGITRPIVYEGRAARVILDSRKMEEIEAYYRQCAEEGANPHQIDESKKAVTNLGVILGDDDLLGNIAADFIRHYEKRVAEGSSVEGKAMIVCPDRQIAFNLYKKIVSERPQWATVPQWQADGELSTAADPRVSYDNAPQPMERIRLVATRSKDDPKELWDMLGTDDDRRELAVQFKNPRSDFKIAIVVDMWITGFDVPCLDTMYIYKPIQQHTLIQTISRVNRVYEGKDKGLVVDYLGIKNNLNAALRKYANGDLGETDIETVSRSVTLVRDEIDILRRMFAPVDYSPFFHGTPMEQLDALNRGAEHAMLTQEQENRFMGHVRKMKQAFNLCAGSEEITADEREHIHYFCGVRSIIHKLTRGEAPDAAQMNRRVATLIEEAILSEKVEEIVQISNNKLQIDLLSGEYMERLQKLEMPNTKVRLMQRLLNMVITDFKRVNKMKGVEFTERLNALVARYNDRSEDLVFADEVLTEVAEQMANLLKEVTAEKRSFNELGITYEEKAFYDILKSIAAKFGFDYPHDKLLALAAAVKQVVDDKSRYTDWAARDDIKAELKMDLILVLAEHGYPPVTNDEVFKEIFEQAENFKRYNN